MSQYPEGLYLITWPDGRKSVGKVYQLFQSSPEKHVMIAGYDYSSSVREELNNGAVFEPLVIPSEPNMSQMMAAIAGKTSKFELRHKNNLWQCEWVIEIDEASREWFLGYVYSTPEEAVRFAWIKVCSEASP